MLTLILIILIFIKIKIKIIPNKLFLLLILFLLVVNEIYNYKFKKEDYNSIQYEGLYDKYYIENKYNHNLDTSTSSVPNCEQKQQKEKINKQKEKINKYKEILNSMNNVFYGKKNIKILNNIDFETISAQTTSAGSSEQGAEAKSAK